MRLLHTSDWHLGRTLYGVDLLPHQATFLDWLLDQAIEHEVHAVVVAGDVYDRAVPPTDAVRLGFGSRLSEVAGVHVRTSVADIARPVLVADEHGEVACYGIPYLLPDAVMGELAADRSHASVLAAAASLIRADAKQRGVARTVVAAHAFVTGAAACESERDIRVGGIGDAPASVFAGLTYVALGHVHGQQDVPSGSAGTTVRYCGSPLAFSFSERNHAKSVTLAEIDGAGQVSVSKLAAPVPRPLHEVRGRLDDLLADASGPGRRPEELAGSWLRVVLTDQVRPASPMERLRERWPHTLVLDFEPQGESVSTAADPARLTQTADPVEICELFVDFAGGGAADAEQLAVLRDVIEAVQHAEASDGEPAPAARPARAARAAAAGLDDAGSVDEWLASAGRDDWLLDEDLAFPKRGGNPAAA